jgi:hypothetical protein
MGFPAPSAVQDGHRVRSGATAPPAWGEHVNAGHAPIHGQEATTHEDFASIFPTTGWRPSLDGTASLRIVSSIRIDCPDGFPYRDLPSVSPVRT